MFLPVACLKCGKLFQVPETAAGTDVACPFCKQPTAALPVAAAPPAPQPLSLDDEPPASASRGNRSFLASAALAMILGVVALAGTLGYLRYGSGEIAPASWA